MRHSIHSARHFENKRDASDFPRPRLSVESSLLTRSIPLLPSASALAILKHFWEILIQAEQIATGIT